CSGAATKQPLTKKIRVGHMEFPPIDHSPTGCLDPSPKTARQEKVDLREQYKGSLQYAEQKKANAREKQQHEDQREKGNSHESGGANGSEAYFSEPIDHNGLEPRQRQVIFLPSQPQYCL